MIERKREKVEKGNREVAETELRRVRKETVLRIMR
jgi:hypothetical protein